MSILLMPAPVMMRMILPLREVVLQYMSFKNVPLYIKGISVFDSFFPVIEEEKSEFWSENQIHNYSLENCSLARLEKGPWNSKQLNINRN